MKVSVIIAAYNIEDYIERCLLSVINQTLKDIEIIVINDGSKDSTLKKIINISKKDNRISIINQENKGIMETRKIGLNTAVGKYLLFVDGDDWLELEALDILYCNAQKYNSDIVLYNTFWSYDTNKIPKNTFEKESEIIEKPLRTLFKGEVLPAIWAKLIKKSYICNNTIELPQNISFAEDLGIVASLFMNNPKISTVDNYLYNYYQRSDSITKSIDKRVLEINEAMEFIKAQLLKKGIYNDNKVYFEYMVYRVIYEWQFLNYNKFDFIHKSLHEQYTSRNIDVYNNKYIYEKIKQYPRGVKMRQNAYFKGYEIGKAYDKLRKFVKNIVQ